MFSLQNFQERLRKINWGRLKKVEDRLIEKIEMMLRRDMAALLESARKIDNDGDVCGADEAKQRKKKSSTLSNKLTFSSRSSETPNMSAAASNLCHGPLDVDDRETPFRQTSESLPAFNQIKIN